MARVGCVMSEVVSRVSRPVSAKVTSSSPVVDVNVTAPRVLSAGSVRHAAPSRIPRPPDRVPTTGPRALYNCTSSR